MSSRAALWLAGGAMVAALFLASACGAGEEESHVTPTTTPLSATATPATPHAASATPATPLAATATAPVGSETPGTTTGGAAGVGIYPTSIDFEQTLRGSEYFRSIGVINPGNSDQTFTFEVGGAAAPWMSLVNPEDRTQVVDTIVVPPQQERRVFLRLLVQPDVPNGTYTGLVRAVSAVAAGAGAEGAGSTVNVGAEISVALEVTGTQNIAGSLRDVAARDVEVGYPLRIRTTVQNSGNVQVNPQIHLEVVDSKGSVVAQATFPGEVVYPNETKILVSEWDTTGQGVGQRVARVSVKFGDLDLGSKQANFNILAVGTLSRQGSLEELTLENAGYAGVMAKIAARFRNTGQIDTRAIFLGEVYYKDALIDTVTTPERLVEVGEDVVIETSIEVPKAGTYTVTGKVNYEGKETQVKELTFKVPHAPGAGEGGVSPWVWILLGCGIVAAALLGASWILTRRVSRLFRR